MHHLTNKQLGILAGVLAVVLLVVLAFSRIASLRADTTGIPPEPVPQPAIPVQLQGDPTFQYLVSYANEGFEPETLTIKKGDTVRFTNNSSAQVWVAAVGESNDPIYPGTSACGGSAFDSCGAFANGSFWQFKFTEVGTYYFQNNTDSTKSGEIIVTAQ